MNTIYNNKTKEEQDVLKFGDIFTLSDFEKVMLAKQYDRLYNDSLEENNRLDKQFKNKRIYNLSIKSIAENLSITLTQIINDIIILSNSDDRSFNNYINIFIIKDRLIYIGILFVIISFFLLFIHLSS